MADIVTGTVTGQVNHSQLHQDHADIRHENSQSEAQIRRDVVGTSGDTRREQAEIGAAAAYQNGVQHAGIVDAVKTAGWANSDRTGMEADRVVQQDTAYFIANQSQTFANATALAALKAGTDSNFNQTLAAIQLANERGVAAAQLSGEKTAAAAALGQAMIGQQIIQDGMLTRGLINDLKYHDLNRALVERNAELVEERYGRRHWRDTAGQNQFAAQSAAIQNQLQAFGSQLNETRQGMVNLGTMTGVGQTSTNNNI